ncbi:MAG: DNA N-6-adenine-methyltransferase [Nanoarchaeota archaeon]
MHSKYVTKTESISQEHGTPDVIFFPLHNEFNFTIDLCASKENALLPKYYTKGDDLFTKEIKETGFANIEFVRAKKFAKYFYEQSQKFGSTIVMLCTVKSNTNWWRDYVMKAREVRFINGKVYFKAEGNTQGLRFPCAIVIFAKHIGDTKFSIFNQAQQTFQKVEDK